MTRRSIDIGFLLLAMGAGSVVFATACGGDDLTCGEGTRKSGSKCVAQVVEPSDDAGGGGADGGTEPDAMVPSGPVIDFDGVTSAAPAAADAVRLTWLPATHPFDATASIRYAIYASTASGQQNFAEPLVIAPPGSTSYRIEGLDAEAQYFVVRALVEDESAVDVNTVEKSATPAEDTAPPTFAGGVMVEPGGSSSVLVTWEPATDDLTPPEGIVYQVLWSDAAMLSTVGALGAVSLPGATSVVVPRLPIPEETYYFNVRAIDAAGNTDENMIELSGVAGEDTVPPVFGGCRAAVNPTAVGATVTWDPAEDDTTLPDAMTYHVYAFDVPVDENTEFGEPAGVFENGPTTVELEGLAQATNYRIICRAVDAFGNEDDNFSIQTFLTDDDGTPPDFDGITDVVVRATEADLEWAAATDDQTAQGQIVYEVFEASASGEQVFDAAPLTTSPPGATGVTIIGLESNRDYFFVVRARDRANNVDENTVEASAKTLVSFMFDVQPIFTENCALIGCHVPGGMAPQGQILAEGYAYSNIVNVVALEGAQITPTPEPEIKRIDPTSSEPLDSYLYRKITGTPPFFGSQMPPQQAQRVLTQEQKETIRLWIVQGALNN